MAPVPPIVQATGLRRDYRQGAVLVRALRGVDLAVEPGEFTALMGPSGSGKTTLLNLLGALDEPTAGEVSIEGRRLSALGDRQRADLRLERLGFVFQSYNLLPVLSAFENVEFVLRLRGVDAGERRRRAMAALAAVGLEGLEHRRPDELSGGQQQRVAVARAIVGDPVLVLADEPTANLDSETGHALIALMRRINEERGTTFLFATHDPKVMDAARRVVRLVDGRVEADERR